MKICDEDHFSVNRTGAYCSERQSASSFGPKVFASTRLQVTHSSPMELARELEKVFESFGHEGEQTGSGDKVGIFFKPGIFGHHKVGRAADIYAVGGLGFDEWKRALGQRVAGTVRPCTDANERRATSGS